MIRAVAAKVLATTLTTVLTEKFLINVLIILAGWAVERWGNDLAEELFAKFKEALDKNQGTPTNLYSEIKESK